MLKYFLINYMYTLIRKSESSFDNLQPALIVASDYPGGKYGTFKNKSIRSIFQEEEII